MNFQAHGNVGNRLWLLQGHNLSTIVNYTMKSAKLSKGFWLHKCFIQCIAVVIMSNVTRYLHSSHQDGCKRMQTEHRAQEARPSIFHIQYSFRTTQGGGIPYDGKALNMIFDNLVGKQLM